MAASSSSLADCIPRERRLNPARRSARRAFQSPAESGLASRVISASWATLYRFKTVFRMRMSRFSPSREGVPPPTYTLSTRWEAAKGAVSVRWAHSAST